jgi:hypothetical protein
MQFPESLLPAELLARSTLAGNERAWPLADVPDVIEGARRTSLASIGGQLQFRLPGATCECYWVQVDTFRLLPSTLPWPELVERTADEALLQFKALRIQYDFIAEGRKSFKDTIEQFEASGGDLEKAMCFVWYLEAEPELRQHWVSPPSTPNRT